MKRSTFVLAFAALALGFAATTVVSQQKPDPVRLGFLDLGTAFKTYRKRKDVMDSLEAKFNVINVQFKQRGKQIEEMTGKLDTMNRDSDEYADLDRRISVEKYTLELDTKLAKRDIERDQRKRFTGIYKEMSDECHAYGAEHGLAAVLMYTPPDADFGDSDLFQATRTVLCRDDQLDVTKDVVARLNAQLGPPPVVPVPPPADPNKLPK